MIESKTPNILVTVCARKGSKGLPSKNIRPLLGKPLIAHTLEHAKAWGRASQIVVSTDSAEIAEAARRYGAEVPFMRPDELATDTAGKLPVITHALIEAERTFSQTFDVVVDLDPTAPLRTPADIARGLDVFLQNASDVCFSVVKARKNPYFNMVERGPDGRIGLVKPPSDGVLSRQAAPEVWDMNASIYIYSRSFLLANPKTLWSAQPEIFEMSPESAFDIDQERDLVITEALMKGISRA